MLEKEQQEQIYREVLQQLGESDESVAEPADFIKPRFMLAAEQRARQVGVTADVILQQDLVKLNSSEYPGPDCLQPEEVEHFVLTGSLAADRMRHVEDCVACATLLELATPTTEYEPVGAESSNLTIEIGRVLTHKIEELELTPDRRHQMRCYIDQVCAQLLSDPKLPANLIRYADSARWPSWAVECLPSLYVEEWEFSESPQVVLFWRYLVECVPEPRNLEVLSTLCGGTVLEARVDSAELFYVRAIAPLFERSRLGNPFASVESMVGVVLDTIRELHLSNTFPEAADALSQARDRIFRNLFSATLEIRPDRKPELTGQALELKGHPWVRSVIKGVA
jgi:hypothetical protein